MNILSLFDGISCGRLALERVGLPVNQYLAAEIDKYARRVTLSNYPDTTMLADVRQVRGENLPQIDLVMGGSPCQDLSRALARAEGLSGERSGLLYEFVQILRECDPKYFLLENVVPRKREWKYKIDKLMGAEGVKINSDRFVQQNRPRIYWTNIEIPPLPERPNWNGEFWRYTRGGKYVRNKSGVCFCFTANMGTGGHKVPLKSPDVNDKLSPEEVEELQGVPRGYTGYVSNSRRYKMLGDGWTVDVIAHIFRGIETQFPRTQI